MEIRDNYLSSEELGTPQPFTPELFNSPSFARESCVSPPPWSPNSRSESLTPLTPTSLLSPPETSPAQPRPGPYDATMSQPVVPPMPAHGDCRAPTFDPSKPRELRCFFEELKFHFGRSNVVNEVTMKKHALRFADCDTAELWEILPKFADTAKMYQDFVDAVYKLYPGSDSEQRWAIADMDKLVGETSWVGILPLADLGRYHREFMVIMMFLITKNHISPAEQSRVFVRGFPLELWNRVAHHLQLKLPDHFPDDPYALEEIHDAMRFVLHGTASYALAYDDQQ